MRRYRPHHLCDYPESRWTNNFADLLRARGITGMQNSADFLVVDKNHQNNFRVSGIASIGAITGPEG